MNILFTICGRAGSKGIKNKNLIDFLGYPLPFYTVSAIDLYIKQNPDVRYDIVLNTDSKELIKLFKEKIKVKVEFIEREPLLSLNSTPKIHVIQNCLKTMKERKKVNYDIVVDLDITSPLRTVEDMQNLINKKIQSDADVIFSVTESRRNPFFNMVKKTENGYTRVMKSSFNTRQEAPEVYDMNASLYAYTIEFLESGKEIFEGKCDIIKMIDTAILDLDHENDYKFLQVIARYLFDINSELNKIRENIKAILN